MAQAPSMSIFRIADTPKSPDEVKARDQQIIDALASNHSGDTDAAYAVAGMLQHFPTAGALKMHNGTVFLAALTPVAVGPASDTATGAKGQFWLHSSGVDICVATDTWLRFSGAAFAAVGV